VVLVVGGLLPMTYAISTGVVSSRLPGIPVLGTRLLFIKAGRPKLNGRSSWGGNKQRTHGHDDY